MKLNYSKSSFLLKTNLVIIFSLKKKEEIDFDGNERVDYLFLSSIMSHKCNQRPRYQDLNTWWWWTGVKDCHIINTMSLNIIISIICVVIKCRYVNSSFHFVYAY